MCDMRNRDKVKMEHTRWLMTPLQLIYHDHVTHRHGLFPCWPCSYSKEKAAQMLSGSLDSSLSSSDTTLPPGRPRTPGLCLGENLSLTYCAHLGG